LSVALEFSGGVTSLASDLLAAAPAVSEIAVYAELVEASTASPTGPGKKRGASRNRRRSRSFLLLEPHDIIHGPILDAFELDGGDVICGVVPAGNLQIRWVEQAPAVLALARIAAQSSPGQSRRLPSLLGRSKTITTDAPLALKNMRALKD
jgi:hypothetical protein